MPGGRAPLLLQNARILITGGARGIGKEFALDLARRGARVGVCAVTQEGLEGIREESKREGLELLACKADVSNEDEVKTLFAGFLDKHGGLDAVINNCQKDNLPF